MPKTFDEYPQPAWNKADTIQGALEAVRAAHDEASSDSAQSRILFATGNNHAGTYCPVILPVLSLLKPMLTSGERWTRHAILQVLIDVLASFEPEPAHEEFMLQGRSSSLKALVMASVAETVGAVTALAASGTWRRWRPNSWN